MICRDTSIKSALKAKQRGFIINPSLLKPPVEGYPTSGLVHYISFNGNNTAKIGPTPTATAPFSTIGDGQSHVYPQCALPTAHWMPVAKNASSYLYNDWTIAMWVWANVSSGAIFHQMGNCYVVHNACQFYDTADRILSYSTVLNVWRFIVWRKSSTVNSTVRIDNTQVASALFTGNNSNAYTNVGFAGARSPSGADLNGRLGPFAMWNRVLSDAEVTTLWNGGAGMQNP